MLRAADGKRLTPIIGSVPHTPKAQTATRAALTALAGVIQIRVSLFVAAHSAALAL